MELQDRLLLLKTDLFQSSVVFLTRVVSTKGFVFFEWDIKISGTNNIVLVSIKVLNLYDLVYINNNISICLEKSKCSRLYLYKI